jgi:two-component system response regulator
VRESLRILAVDDDLGDLMLITEALQAQSALVEMATAGDGVEALAHLRSRSTPPDLILLDLNMPRMDGRELLTVLKHDEELKAIPVVVLTTSSTDQDVVGCYRDRANAYVTKPIDLSEFNDVVAGIEHFYGQIARRPNTT